MLTKRCRAALTGSGPLRMVRRRIIQGRRRMSQHALQQPIEELWERRDSLSSATGGGAREAVEAALDLLDSGAARVAEPTGQADLAPGR